jgi:hypothetical protein
MKSLHQQFLSLGRERNKITYKLLSLLPQIYKQKVYEAHGYATIYEYAGKLAGLSHSVVEKALKLEEKLKDKPNLQKAIETQGIHKVALVANIATPENEKMFADKVENMSKPALQQFSRECRGKIQTTFQIELDTEMMEAFLKLKKEMKSENLSNKEALRRMLNMMVRNEKPQPEAKIFKKIPGEKVVCHSRLSHSALLPCHSALDAESKIPAFAGMTNPAGITNAAEMTNGMTTRITRYIPVAQKRLLLSQTNGLCSHKSCHNPAEIFHHQLRFSTSKNHSSLIPLCKIHHEFAHNGITETMTESDEHYRKYRQAALI